ncbi:MAG: hypothetical protein AAB227_08660 [Pseudomonadota bacterium]
MTTAAAILIFSAALIAAIASYAIARLAVSLNLFPDRPNGRSSHKAATPRAGGFAIFGGFAIAMLLMIALQWTNGEGADYAATLALGFGAFAFGAVDDARSLGARLKLALQIALALGFIAVFGAVETIPAPFIGELRLGAAAIPLTALWIVGFMNAFNFMDGINGIAGACALFALSALAIMGAAGEGVWAAPAIFLAAALLGYLPLNFISGRIFMGDCGSQFVGFMIAVLATLSGNADSAAAPLSRMFIPIVFLPFIVDVAFTLSHRLRRGRNILEAHNEHVYQLLVRMGRSHQAVATLYLTGVVLSTAVAIAVNGRAPSVQYAGALGLIVLMVALSAMAVRRAGAAGLLTNVAEEPMSPPAEQSAQRPAAAE